ncbi:LRR domain containing protein [Trema orientale]|uniref:LRR domain containing protein n=1 Tax=Trema orientale TaxID=63057 RepID=A0A2P5EQY1_TREOI|nr:LRR domain containing protein [Trema orientale]
MEALKLVSTLFLTLIILVFTCPNPSLSAQLCCPKDKKVLLQIKKAFKDPYTYASWDPSSDCCDWYGVECHEKTHQVISFSANNGDLSGPIPPQVAELPYLQYLDFHKQPNITGSIPPAIAKLMNLKSLSITWTKITGPILDFLGQLKNLDFIALSYCWK